MLCQTCVLFLTGGQSPNRLPAAARCSVNCWHPEEARRGCNQPCKTWWSYRWSVTTCSGAQNTHPTTRYGNRRLYLRHCTIALIISLRLFIPSCPIWPAQITGHSTTPKSVICFHPFSAMAHVFDSLTYICIQSEWFWGYLQNHGQRKRHKNSLKYAQIYIHVMLTAFTGKKLLLQTFYRLNTLCYRRSWVKKHYRSYW